MGLRTKALEAIFQRMPAIYGASWDRMLGSAPINDIKTAWAHELAGFDNRLEDIAWAFEHLPEKCPNLIEFRNLCRQAPRVEAPQLEAPRADPERLKEELKKLGQITSKPRPSDKDWARAIINRANAGERVTPISLRFAKEALRSEG